MRLSRSLLIAATAGFLLSSCGSKDSAPDDSGLTRVVGDAGTVASDGGWALPDVGTNSAADQALPAPDAIVADAAPDISDSPDVRSADAPALAADAPGVDAAQEPDAEPDATPDAVAMCGRVLTCDCKYKGTLLRGDMAYVDRLPYNFTVFEVKNNLADLFVQDVPRPGSTNRCGQWQPDAFIPTFRVMKVNSPAQADFTIQYVKPAELPGLPGMRY